MGSIWKIRKHKHVKEVLVVFYAAGLICGLSTVENLQTYGEAIGTFWPLNAIGNKKTDIIKKWLSLCRNEQQMKHPVIVKYSSLKIII